MFGHNFSFRVHFFRRIGAFCERLFLDKHLLRVANQFELGEAGPVSDVGGDTPRPSEGIKKMAPLQGVLVRLSSSRGGGGNLPLDFGRGQKQRARRLISSHPVPDPVTDSLHFDETAISKHAPRLQPFFSSPFSFLHIPSFPSRIQAPLTFVRFPSHLVSSRIGCLLDTFQLRLFCASVNMGVETYEKPDGATKNIDNLNQEGPGLELTTVLPEGVPANSRGVPTYAGLTGTAL